jgi:hypothetical protein
VIENPPPNSQFHYKRNPKNPIKKYRTQITKTNKQNLKKVKNWKHFNIKHAP